MVSSVYQKKRNFKKSPEPQWKIHHKAHSSSIFVVQKHWASHLHFDFRLSIHGVLKSWAIPKGPSLNPSDKRLAVGTEDHPLAYAQFEGVIPEKEYGAGTVMVWDLGTWELLDDNLETSLKQRKINFILKGHKMKGRWVLLGMSNNKKNWLLIKVKDEEASTKDNARWLNTPSALTGKKKEEIEENAS